MTELPRALAELAAARQHSREAFEQYLSDYLSGALMHLDHWRVGVSDAREYLDRAENWESETAALADWARFQILVERTQADVKAIKAAAAALR